MSLLAQLALVVAALIHLLPLPGVLGARQLERLYGVALAQPELVLLMRHRAVLFGVVGGLLAAAVFRPELRPVALTVGLVSAGSFLALALPAGPLSDALQRVVVADVVAVAALSLAAVVTWRA
jgi:hypothetical protein